MQIPFADTVLGLVGLRPAAPDRVDDAGPIIDDTDNADELADNVDRSDTSLLLQKMENRLIRHHLDNPEVLGADDLRRLRYLLNFARLADFEPGAAGPGGYRGRGDVSVGDEIAPWRSRVVDALYGPLREERDPVTALTAAREVLATLADGQDEQRSLLADRHGGDFSLAELDAEVGYKKLVMVLGGGGGSGFVYIGGMQRLLEAGQVPDYLVGASIGSILGAVVSRTLPIPIDEYVEWAKTVSYRAILAPEGRHRRHGLTGMFSLRFDEFAEAMFSRADGRQMRMSELAIPFDAVVAGVRKQFFANLPSRFRQQRLAALQLRALPYLPIGIGPQVAARMWQVAAFIDPRVTKPIIIGGDDPGRNLNVVDAASFSASIPGVLHHESGDPRMLPMLDALLDDNDVAALVDGGVASNVPVELAWKRVRDGRLGTRNACYLAFDCFHPQWDPRHLWLVPITQAVQLQMVRNAPYADHLVRFQATLSPVNLAPSADAIDRACGWGQESVEAAIPLISALLQPIWWEGDGPARPNAEPAAPAISVANPMSAVMAAIQLPRNGFERWRHRVLTSAGDRQRRLYRQQAIQPDQTDDDDHHP
ncbi:MAG TPA: patatin-like phospholipase family protein [Mycobacterium sp.]|nr:patatin-like phospholipase family protein [Mycobacterium sp.]